MEDAYIVNGGKRLSGTVTLSGAKNLALKTIIASVLFDSTVTLENVPKINDVEELLHLLEKLGAKVLHKNGTLTIDPTTITQNKPDLLHASQLRASFLLFAPLLHKFKECFIPNPGGCRIGQRPIDRIVAGMEALGVMVEYDSGSGYYHAKLPSTPSGTYEFEKSTHTGTELLIMLGAIGDKEVVIKNAALEPEIDELIKFLIESGAQIQKNGTDITIQGVSSLKQTIPFKIFGDRNEAVTFATLAVATKGEVEIRDLNADNLSTFNEAMKQAGVEVRVKENSVTYKYTGVLRAVSVETKPHPGFMTDWQPNWAVLMTQADGTSIVHETVFENRFSYVEELKKLGANIEFQNAEVSNPEKVYDFHWEKGKDHLQKIAVTGGHPLHAGVLKISDLRAGATLLIAALIAQGESVVSNATILERGYQNIVEKITALGGTLKRV